MEETHPPKSALTLDAHIDIPWIMTKHGEFDLSKDNRGAISMVDFPRMKKGGLNCAVFALYLSDLLQDQIGQGKATIEIMSQIKRLLPYIAYDSKQARMRVSEGTTPIFLALEGGRLINDSLEMLRKFQTIGIKYLTLTHNRNTDWADSATDNAKHKGMTEFGFTVVEECERLGIFVDISHASDATAYNVLSIAEKPVLATHSGVRSLINHPRNLSDRLIKKIAESGGFVGVPFARRFIGSSFKDIINHITHIVDLVGPAHVGIGSDLDGAEMVPNTSDVSKWSHVVKDGLSHKGYSDDTINMIAGENLLRLFE